MLRIKPTEHLTGITIQGDYNDFYELTESIYRLTCCADDKTNLYYGVENRLLGLCYEIRHAYMGTREIVLEDNGMHEDLMKWHEIITPTKNVYYSVNILFPQAIFVAASVPTMYWYARRLYGTKRKNEDLDYELPAVPYAYYLRDKANLEVLCAGIWQSLGEAVGDEELQKLMKMVQRLEEGEYIRYATHYIDKCDMELLKTPVDKRRDKLKNIAKRILKKPAAYENMKRDLEYWAKEYNVSIYDLSIPDFEDPDLTEIDW